MSEQVSDGPMLLLHAEQHRWCNRQERDEQLLTQSIHVPVVYFCTIMSPAGFK